MCKAFPNLRIKLILAEVGVSVVMKPHLTLASVFRKPKDPSILFENKAGLVYQLPCSDCDAAGETGRSMETRKREHVMQ